MIRWRDIKVDGKPACFIDIDGKRLYINQRNDGAFSAFVDGQKVGLHYPTLSAAQAAALTVIGINPPPDPFRFSPTQPAPAAPTLPASVETGTITFENGSQIHFTEEAVERLPSGRKKPLREETVTKLAAFPIADLSAPVESVQLRDPDDAPRAVVIAMQALAPSVPGLTCGCGAKLGRSGRCPALCTPVERDPPAYTGPLKVGRSHTARLGAPVSF